MIERLRIKNFALIETLEIELSSGFNVISGETGAGKTIIMQAVGLLLGERTSKDILRGGAANCEISAEIKLGMAVKRNLHFLDALGIEIPKDESLLLRRVITETTSKNYINDSPVSLQTLKMLGEILIDTHGPHEHQSILKQSVQLNLLDRYAGLDDDVSRCTEFYKEWKDALSEKEEFDKHLPDSREEDYLRHSLEEIASASPRENEDKEISTKHNLISHSQNILETTGILLKILSESEDSILEKLFEINRGLLSLEKNDPENATSFMADTEEIRSRILSLSNKFSDYASSIEIDEKEFIRVEERLKTLTSLKRKYGPEIKDILKTEEEAKEKLEKINNSSEIRASLDAKIAKAKGNWENSAKKLSEKRKIASAKFAKEATSELKKLGFMKSSFGVEFLNNEPSQNGYDKIEFMFTANPGETKKALRNVASSGEISRVMLALKTILASVDSVPILIFDEIDSNIGGTTAVIVGKELAKLANTHQLICISHLPQVASEAEQHFVVEKKTRGERTFTEIKKLNNEEKITELARMLGGTDAAFKHAQEMMRTEK